MRRLTTANMADTQFRRYLPVGKYSDLYIHFSGTAAAAQTMTAAALGELRIAVDGFYKQQMRVSDLQTIENILSGVEDTTSNTGSSFSFTCRLRQALPGDLINVLDVNRNDKATLEWQAGANFGTLFSSGTIYVYGVENEIGIQKYFLRQNFEDDPLPAGQGTKHFVGRENLARIFVENNTNIARLAIVVDGKTKIEAERSSMVGWTHSNNRLETFSASLPYIDVDLLASKTLDESLSDNVSALIALSTADTITFLVWAIDFADSTTLNASIASQAQVIEVKRQRKASTGKIRPVNVIQTLKTSSPV